MTNSAKNPYVVITVEPDAFDGNGKSDHRHHVSKDGRVDVLFVDGECQVDHGLNSATLAGLRMVFEHRPVQFRPLDNHAIAQLRAFIYGR